MGRNKKLSDDAKAEILRRLDAGESQTSVVKSMNLSSYSVRALAPRVNLTDEQSKEIVKLVSSGKTIDEVARQFNVSKTRIWRATRHLRGDRKETPVEKKREMSRRVLSGEQIASVARDLKISRTTAYRLGTKIGVGFKPTEAQEAAILLERSEGKTVTQISSELGLPSRAVTAMVGIDRSMRYSNEQRQAAIQAVESGANIKVAAEKIGAKRGIVSFWFNEAVKRGEAKRPARKTAKCDDFDFLWITREDPELEDWRQLIVGWLEEKNPPMGRATEAITAFIVRYIVALKLPKKPADLLRRGRLLPDFYLTACPTSEKGRAHAKTIHGLVEWVLDSPDFADNDDGIVIRLSHLYVNPFNCDPSRCSSRRDPESNKVVMAYYLISNLRKRIVQGPHFRDWTWMQGLGGMQTHNGQQNAGDWFPVTEDRIDQMDLDCVWRLRKREHDIPILEMWSPVRWVLHLIHLQTTTRVGQARLVDSGEADTFVYENGEFIPNAGPLKRGTASKPHQQGIFRCPSAHDVARGATAYLYFNSNKTADIGKYGESKGFVCAWPRLENLDEDPYYWLAKLRDGQLKYYPITRLTRWTELTGDRKPSSQTKEQLAEYPETAFLFRLPESPEVPGPIGAGALKEAWKKIIVAYEAILFAEGHRHPSGKPIELINPETGWPWSSPHATRVSLITHLILDGNVPVELMMKIVGHARIIMTVYYTKVGLTRIQDAIRGAVEKLDATKYETFERDLLNTEAERVSDKIVFNAEEWGTILPVNPCDRTPLGWLHLHDGICLAGGNAENESLPGCHNGGPAVAGVAGQSKSRHGPAPGGVRNCCRCRWKCAGKVHVPAMAATLNNRSYHLHRASANAIAAERDRNKLLQEKAQVESADRPYMRTRELIDAERKYEAAMQLMQQLALDIVQINAQIERATRLPDKTDGSMALAAQGDMTSLHAVLEETDSELLVLAGVCADVEFFPDLDPGTAVFEFAQLLDRAFEREGQPLILARLSQSEKLAAANSIMRELEWHANPNSPILARRQVVEIMDRGESLESILGVNLKDILKMAHSSDSKSISIGNQKPNGAGHDNDQQRAS